MSTQEWEGGLVTGLGPVNYLGCEMMEMLSSSSPKNWLLQPLVNDATVLEVLLLIANFTLLPPSKPYILASSIPKWSQLKTLKEKRLQGEREVQTIGHKIGSRMYCTTRGI